MLFQSTHPVWGATVVWIGQFRSTLFQSTHPVWGATGHPLCVSYVVAFQSTHPVWGATVSTSRDVSSGNVSIHAPRVGCDFQILANQVLSYMFQSTHPVWGATC